MAKRKIYDVKPPKRHAKKENPIKEFLEATPIAAVMGSTAATAKKKKSNNKNFLLRKPMVTAGVGVLVVVAVYLFFALPKADITLWPAVNTLSYQQTITADQSAQQVDPANLVIPAKTFTDSKTESEDFPATGSASNAGTASGTITVFNKTSPASSIDLRSGTHFLSDSGLLFVSLKSITVPAATSKGPGSVSVAVQAVASGSNYNIAASNFSIPGLKGTNYYYSVYATSAAAMAGGYSGSVKEVTSDDLQSAQDTFQQKITADAVADLKTQVPAGYIVLDDAVSSNVTMDPSSAVKTGTVEQTFTLSGSAAVQVVAFKKSDLDQLATSYIESQLDSGKSILANTLKEDYTVSSLDSTNGKASINLSFSAGTYQNVDQNAITSAVGGQSAFQMNQTIATMLGSSLNKQQISLWPFWVTHAPNNQKAIHVFVKFN